MDSAAADVAAIEADAVADGPIAKAIAHYQTLGRRRLHVPGHGGRRLFASVGVGASLLQADLSEVEGLDVLSEPEGCIAESQAMAAEVFGVAHSYYLVNGASVGLQAAMLAALRPQDEVLIARNAHRSLLSGLILTGARPIWLLPQRLDARGLWGALSPDVVAEALDAHPRARMAAFVSPTYEGVATDVAAIAALCRERGVLTLVDEAHGALWPFHDAMPLSAIRAGCDFVAHSLHKAPGSLTQTAIAHLPGGSRLPAQRFQQALNTLHTTSPSYPLLASAEAAVGWLSSPEGRARLEATLQRSASLRGGLARELRHFRLLGESDAHAPLDPMALFVSAPVEGGDVWGARLERDRGIAFESVSPAGVLYKLGLGLSGSDFGALAAALRQEDMRLATESGGGAPTTKTLLEASFSLPEVVMTPREAFFAPGERIPSSLAAGRVAQETIVHCPPGVPVTIPGERIAPALLEALPPTLIVTAR